ncbi:MAG TPA: luciferase family protein [Steroidobacteraceae bacterium]|nr:luciferase family protein [Steroidobacteraceae bacterium]
MNALRKSISQRLQELGVEERAWPGRDDGFASLVYRGKDFAHFHHDGEIDIRLGKEVIRREKLAHPADSVVHPERAAGSPWYEMKLRTAADVDEAIRLVRLAIQGIKARP